MAQYSKEQLRSIFQNRFNQEAWNLIVVNIFGAGQVRRVYEKFTSDEDLEEGYFLGSIDTPDSYRIGLFYYKINSGSIAHKKVGFRNLVKRFINQNWGEFDAAIVVFNDGEEWRLSFICDIKEEATAPKRFTYVFGEHDNFYKTPVDRFEELQKQQPTFANIRKTFSVDALSDDFFDDYRELYADFVQYITGKRYVKSGSKWEEKTITRPNHQFQTTFEGNDKLVRDYIKKMFGRIVFLYFLQRKGWLNGNKQYMHDLFYNSDKKDDFLDGVLEPLFFEVLNEEKPNRSKEAKSLPGCYNIPYLNGGLFARDEIDERTCIFPAEYFKRLFDFLDSYNFTIDENDTDDAEIGIDPEMLGRIFENLLEDNKDKGAFYTPKEIVDYMCRESLIAYLENGSENIISKERIRELIEKYEGEGLTRDQRSFIKDKLKSVKICDPAIGSGAFPMGLVNILSKIYEVLRLSTDMAQIKRHIMEQNIYGVDIEKGAVDIARLRFWLSMIVEEKEPIPLPNLHFKIMQGNSLLESYNGIDLSDLTKVNAQKGLWDSENFERENLIEALIKYYKTSDHIERDRLFNEIINNVRRQLLAKGITLPNGEDPSANTDFFLWHTWFSDVFANGGFDIVIGNPPYVTNLDSKEKILLSKLYPAAKKKIFDLYNFFMVFVHRILSSHYGVASMIVPPTWLSNENSSELRRLLAENGLFKINFFEEGVFKNAVVNSCIYFTSPAIQSTIDCYASNIKNNTVTSVKRNEINSQLIKSNGTVIPLEKSKGLLDLIQKRTKTINLGNISDIVFGIQDRKSSADPSYISEYKLDDNHKKVLNGKHINRYSLKESGLFINYGSWLWNPRNPKIFEAKEKILIRQVGKYPICTYDNNQYYTLNTIYNVVITNVDFDTKYILALLNSRIMQFIWKEIYPEQKDVFPRLKKEQLIKIPIPYVSPEVQKILSNCVKLILGNHDEDKTLEMENTINILTYKLYGIEWNEVISLDPETNLSQKEFDSYVI